MPNIKEKISQAKAKLLVDYPYFGTIASRIELVQNDDIQAFKSDGIKLEYNSDFFAEIELSEMEFVFANGAMHASLAHKSRKNGRSGWLWQMATDYAVNDMLVENGLDRPWQATYSKRFSNLYAEEIYEELKDDILRDELEYEADDIDEVRPNEDDVHNDNSQSEEQGSSSKNNSDSDEPNQEEDIEQIIQDELLKEQLFEEFAKATLESEMKKDEFPDGLERFFDLSLGGKIDWRDELKSALERFHKDDYTLIPPNKKFLHMGIYLPSCTSNRFQLVIAVDSSGSVDEELLNEFLSEINFLMLTIQDYQIDLLVCDDKIHSHNTFYSGDNLEVKLQGNGGTDFRAVFDFIDENLPDTKLLLYFTDLDGRFPLELPRYDVKWVTQKELEVPFGEIILI